MVDSHRELKVDQTVSWHVTIFIFSFTFTTVFSVLAYRQDADSPVNVLHERRIASSCQTVLCKAAVDVDPKLMAAAPG
jgi:hypothetical protein